MLDSDDYVSADFLERYNSAIEEFGADIVVPHAIHITDDEKILCEWGAYQNDFSKSISGKKAFELSVDWQICGCACYERELFLKFGAAEKKLMNADELVTRKLFAASKIVAFSRGTYFYRANQNSTTKKSFSVKIYDMMETQYGLFKFAKEIGAEEESVVKISDGFLGLAFSLKIKFLREKKNYPAEDRKKAEEKLKKGFAILKSGELKFSKSRAEIAAYFLIFGLAGGIYARFGECPAVKKAVSFAKKILKKKRK
jgi:hypothetical protein